MADVGFARGEVRWQSRGASLKRDSVGGAPVSSEMGFFIVIPKRG